MPLGHRRRQLATGRSRNRTTHQCPAMAPSPTATGPEASRHMAHLLLYYRYLARHLLAQSVEQRSERKTFNKLESLFDQLIDTKADDLHRLTLSSDAFLLSKSCEDNNNLLSVNELASHVHKLTPLISSTHLLVSNGHPKAPLVKDNEIEIKIVKSGSSHTYSPIKSTKEIIEIKNVTGKSATLSSTNRMLGRVSKKRKLPEPINDVKEEKIKEEDEKTEVASSQNSDHEYDSTSNDSNEGEDEEKDKSWVQRSNRPRRACTLASVKSFAASKKQLLKEMTGKKKSKDEESIVASQVGGSIAVVDNWQPNSNVDTEGASAKNRPVEELVVNCDPFSLLASEAQLTPTGSVLSQPVSISPTIGRQLILNNNNLDTSTINSLVKQTTIPRLIVPPSATSSAALGPLVSNKPATSTTLSTPAALAPGAPSVAIAPGRSLGKVLMINSVPFLIRDGDKLHIPMLSDSSSANALAKNLGRVMSNSGPQRAKSPSNVPIGASVPVVQTALQSTASLKKKAALKVDPMAVVREIREKRKLAAENEKRKLESTHPVKWPKRRGRPPKTKVQQATKFILPKLAPPTSVAGKESSLIALSSASQPGSTVSKSANSIKPKRENAIDLVIAPTESSAPVKVLATSPQCQEVVASGSSLLSASPSAPSILQKQSHLDLRRQLKQLKMQCKASNANCITSPAEQPPLVSVADTSSPTSSKSSIMNPTLIATLANRRKGSMQNRIVPPLPVASEQQQSGHRESGPNVVIVQPMPPITKQNKDYSKYRRSKSELFDQLKFTRYTPMLDPTNKNVIVFRNDMTNTIMGYKCNHEDCPGFVSPRKDKVLLHIRSRHSSKSSAPSSTPSAVSTGGATTNERPYRCTTPGCWKEFKTNKNLRGHMAHHFYEKPFVCQVPGCTKRFVYSYELKDHQQIVHKYLLKTKLGDEAIIVTQSDSVNTQE